MSASVNQISPGLLFTLAVAAVSASGSSRAGEGQQTYQLCAACHQPDGAGIPGIFPPLKNRLAAIMNSVEGREYVTMALTSGIFGTIMIDGQSYVGAMPAQNLSDAQVADVVNYIASDFGQPAADSEKVTLGQEEVAEIRSRHMGANTHSTLELRSKVSVLNGQ